MHDHANHLLLLDNFENDLAFELVMPHYLLRIFLCKKFLHLYDIIIFVCIHFHYFPCIQLTISFTYKKITSCINMFGDFNELCCRSPPGPPPGPPPLEVVLKHFYSDLQERDAPPSPAELPFPPLKWLTKITEKK